MPYVKKDLAMFFDSYEDLFKPFERLTQEWFRPAEEADEECEEKKACCDKESKPCAEDECHSWCRQKEVKKVNGDVKYRSDREWKDGKLVKNEVYDPKKAIDSPKCDKKACKASEGKKERVRNDEAKVRIDRERYEQLIEAEKMLHHYKECNRVLESRLAEERKEHSELLNRLHEALGVIQP